MHNNPIIGFDPDALRNQGNLFIVNNIDIEEFSISI
jgi:hypothetical protein